MCIVYERFPIVVVFLVLKFDVLTLSSNIRVGRKCFVVLVVCVLMLASKCLTITYCFDIVSSKNEEDVKNSKIFQKISRLLCWKREEGMKYSCYTWPFSDTPFTTLADIKKTNFDLLSFRPNSIWTWNLNSIKCPIQAEEKLAKISTNQANNHENNK